MTPDEAMTQAIARTPAIVRLDLADQALDALMTWRDIDTQHGTHTDAGWMALANLRDAADRIYQLAHEIGE